MGKDLSIYREMDVYNLKKVFIERAKKINEMIDYYNKKGKLKNIQKINIENIPDDKDKLFNSIISMDIKIELNKLAKSFKK